MSTFKRITQWLSLSLNNGRPLSKPAEPEAYPDSLDTPGARAERQAALFLRQQGLEFIAHNYRCKLGEIDLIMRDGNVLVFVEVRSRKYHRFGSAIETVNWRKQRKLILAARHYLHVYKLTEREICRFDVVGVETGPRPSVLITWIRDAFSAF